MNNSAWSIGRRLTVSAGAVVCLVLSLFLVALWSTVTASRWTSRVTQVTNAQSLHQNIDMSHDAIFGIVIEGVLDARSGHSELVDQSSARLEDEWARTSSTLVSLSARGLSAELDTQVSRAATDLEDYVKRGRELLAAAFDDIDSDAVDRMVAEFLESRDHLERSLAVITLEFATHATEMRADAALARNRSTRIIGLVAMTAIAVIVAMSAIVYRSIQRSLIHERSVAEDVAFSQELLSALEMADDEPAVLSLAGRAIARAGNSPAELLLADSSQSHLRAVAAHPTAGGPGCCVQSPLQCAAVRRGVTLTFASSSDLDVCPRLAARGGEPVAAVCSPVSFMGTAIGVLHAARPAADPFSARESGRVDTITVGIGTRLGTLRAFHTTQLQASTDALTGLPNRRSIEHRIHTLLATERSFCLVMADLDHFKLLNDTYGHDVGDRWLRKFAGILTSTQRSTDLIARWGGEEFLLVFPDTKIGDATALCERIRAEMAAAESASLPRATASFGVVDSCDGHTLEELFPLADRALYAAKLAGRNRVVVSAEAANLDPLIPTAG